MFAVMVDAKGAWEADCLYSLWTSEKMAKKEAKRLNESEMSLGCYGGSAHVVEVAVDISRDEYVDHQKGEIL